MNDHDNNTAYVLMTIAFILMLLSGCFLEPSGSDPRCKQWEGRSHLACKGGHG